MRLDASDLRIIVGELAGWSGLDRLPDGSRQLDASMETLDSLSSCSTPSASPHANSASGSASR